MLSPRNPSEAPREAQAATPDTTASEGRSTSQPSPAEASSEATLPDLAWALIERRWTVLAFTGAVLALALAYLFVVPPSYQSSILIRVEGRTTPIAAFENLSELFDAQTPVEGEMRIMRSRPLLEAVIDRLGLDVEARPRTLPLVGDAIARRHEGTEPASPPLGLGSFAWGGERLRVERLAVSDALVGEPLVLTALEDGRYRIAADDGTLLAEGSVGNAATGTAGESRIEVQVAELIARPGTRFTLRKVRRLDAVERLQDALRIVEQGRTTGLVELTLTGEDPARIATVLDALAATYARQSVELTSAEASKTLKILEAQLPVLRKALDKAERTLNVFRRKNSTVNLSLEGESMLRRIAEIDRSIAEHELKATEMGDRYTARHPDVAPLAQRAAQLQAQRAAMEARIQALPGLELESVRLSRQVRVATELYMLVLNRAEELRIVKSGWIGNVRVLEQAVVPYRPVRPKPELVLTLAVLLGLAGGVGVALARNALNRGVKDPDAIEEGTGLPVIATIPHSAAERRLARRGRRGRLSALAVVDPGDAAVEDLRSLRTSVQFALLRAQSNVITIGGLAPKAGKSFVSVNLAHLLAAAHGRVLLVDGDLRRGVLHRYFGVDAQPGLAEVVRGTAPLEDALRSAVAPNLDLLPAGGQVANPAELLAGAPFQQTVSQLRERYKVVIVDTPPILSVTDSALVGRIAGVNLLVFRAGEHSAREISAALRRLVQNGVTVRGAILNDVRPSYGRYGRGRYRRYEIRHDAR